MEESSNIIRYDQAFILALRESPLVSVPDNFDASFIEIYTDRRKKMYRNDGDDKNYMLPSPSLSDRSSIVLGPPKISFASSKQAIKTSEEQSRYMMSSRRGLKQNSDDRSKNMYRNRYQRNMRDRSESFEHNNLVSPTNQMHNHNYQNSYENNRNSNEKGWKYNHQKDKSFENDEESGQHHSNNSLNGENRKRNQYQQDKYNNIEDHKRNRDRMMKFDKDKYSLRMPNNESRDRNQNKRDDGTKYSYKSPGLASAPVGKMDYHSYRKQDDVPEWMNYSPLDDDKLGTTDKNKVDDFQIFKAKMNNRQGLSSLSKSSQYNDKESFFDEDIKKNSEKNIINEFDKINNETAENNRKLRNDLNDLQNQNKKEFFDIDQSGKIFNSVDQYFTNSLESKTPEQLPSIFTNNIGYSIDNPEGKKSADSSVSGSKFSRFFSSSNESVQESTGNEVPPLPSHISNFDLQGMQNPMMPSSLLENSASLLGNNNSNLTSPMQQSSPAILPPPPPGNFINLPENNINNLPNNNPVANINELNKHEESSIIDSFISKYSIPPEKIINNANPPPLPLPPPLPINLPQQMPSPNMLNNMNQPGELPINLANALQQPPLPPNIPPINFNNQLPFNQLPMNMGSPMLQSNPPFSEKKIYSEEDILKSMGIKKSENDEHEKTEKDIEQDKESMNRVMDLLAKSMNAKLGINEADKQGINSNEAVQSPATKPVFANSPSGSAPFNNDQSGQLPKQNKSNTEMRKQSESKPNDTPKSKKNSISSNQSSSQILQNLVQRTIESKLGGNIMSESKSSIHDDDELDEIEPSKPVNVKNEPLKPQTPNMEMNNINNNMNVNMNNLPFNQGMNNQNMMNQLPMMGFGNNMYDQLPMNKEEILPPQFMQQRPPIPMMQQGQNFMDSSPQINPNMFLQFNQNLPPQLQFPPQFQNDISLHQGIYPGMMQNMASQQSQQQMLMDNFMNGRSIPVSMMLSENIGNNPPQYITVEELERSQQSK